MVGVFTEEVDELLGVITRTARGLQDKRRRVDVWEMVKVDLLGSLGHVVGRAL